MRANALPSVAVMALAVLSFVGCAHQGSSKKSTDDGAASVQAIEIGALADGRTLEGFQLDNGRGLTATVSRLGATLHRVRFAGADGVVEDIVLGHDRLADRLGRRSPAGALAGRTTGIIRNASIKIDRLEHRLAVNDLGQHVDGGPDGFGMRLWDAESFATDEGVGVHFSLTSPAGDQGYPGQLTAKVTWMLTRDHELFCETAVLVDAASPVDIAPSVWFALGGPDGDIRGHTLRLWTDGVLKATEDGARVAVAETKDGPFDFDPARSIGDRMKHTGGVYNHVLVTRDRDQSLVAVAEIVDPESRRGVEIWTTSPAFKLETAQRLAGSYGLGGTKIGHWSGLMVRPQGYPDANAHPELPTNLLKPGVEAHEVLRLRFFLAD